MIDNLQLSGMHTPESQSNMATAIANTDLSGNVIISDENILCTSHNAICGGIYGDVDNWLSALSVLNRCVDLRIIFSVRNTADWVESIYLKHFLGASQQGKFPAKLNEFLEAKNFQTKGMKHSWLPIVSRMREIVGPERIYLISYDRLELGLENYMLTLFEPLRENPHVVGQMNFESGRANRSPGTAYVDIYNDIFPHIARDAEPEAARIIRARVAVQLAQSLKGVDKPKALMGKKMKAILDERYSADKLELQL